MIISTRSKPPNLFVNVEMLDARLDTCCSYPVPSLHVSFTVCKDTP